MATAFITAVGSLPWHKVTPYLPDIYEAAKKLVVRNQAATLTTESATGTATADENREMIAELQSGLATASELIAGLTQAQSTMVARIDALQRQLFLALALAGAALLAAGIAIGRG